MKCTAYAVARIGCYHMEIRSSYLFIKGEEDDGIITIRR